MYIDLKSQISHHYFCFFPIASSTSFTSFFRIFHDSMLRVIPFFVGNHFPFFSKYSLRLMLIEPLNDPTDKRLDLVRGQYSSPSSLTSFIGFSSSSNSSYSSSLRAYSSLAALNFLACFYLIASFLLIY